MIFIELIDISINETVIPVALPPLCQLRLLFLTPSTPPEYQPASPHPWCSLPLMHQDAPVMSEHPSTALFAPNTLWLGLLQKMSSPEILAVKSSQKSLKTYFGFKLYPKSSICCNSWCMVWWWRLCSMLNTNLDEVPLELLEFRESRTFLCVESMIYPI